jgi:hypothetical protein
MAQEGASGRRISMGLWFIDLYGDVLRDSTAAATAADPSEEPESQSRQMQHVHLKEFL